MLQVQYNFHCLLLIIASGVLDAKQFISAKERVLSAREMEVLSYLVRGKTAKEIGHLLTISRRTVEHHIENIKIKTNCSTKSELIYMFWN